MIGIIGFGNLRIIQYVDKYAIALDGEGIPYEVLYFDRNNEDERKNFRGPSIAYRRNMNTYQRFWRKAGGFAGYAAFLYRTIRARKYDKLIVLTTPTAIILLPLLLTRYRKKFIYDYRDITYEEVVPYRWLVVRLMKASWKVMISSLGFLKKLKLEHPQSAIDFTVAHNCVDMTPVPIESGGRGDDPVRIVFWGMVRQPEFNKALCLLFGNDRRFDLSFHGEGYGEELRRFCEGNGLTNVHITGRYDRERIPDFARRTDILHCIYENDEQMKHSLQVKIYDAVRFRLPLLMREGSYALSYVEKFGVAKAVRLTERLPDEVYEWYKNLNSEALRRGHQALLDAIRRDEALFLSSLRDFAGAEEPIEGVRSSA